MHVYQVLRSEYFVFKFGGRLNLMAIFSFSPSFARELMKRPNTFMIYFQSSYGYMHAHKPLSSENLFLKNGGPFKMLTIYY